MMRPIIPGTVSQERSPQELGLGSRPRLPAYILHLGDAASPPAPPASERGDTSETRGWLPSAGRDLLGPSLSLAPY